MDAARRTLGAHPDPPHRSWPVRALRRVVRELTWIIVLTTDLGRRAGSFLFRSEYVLASGCTKRGACCHHILLEWSPWFERWPWLGRMLLWKYTRLYSFYDKGYTWEIEDGFMARVLGCHALRSDGLCGEHRTRPLVCRTYPELPLVGRPMLLKGCGYKVARRDGRPEADEGLVQIGRPKRLDP
jgi:hypothetical protein